MKKYVRKFINQLKKAFSSIGNVIKTLFDTWPKAFVGVVLALIVAYYPLGGKMSESIDRTAEYNFDGISEKQSQGIEMMAFLIDREVNEHIWTPNLPFFFPAYCLDNMPNFQKGIIRGIRGLAVAVAKQMQCKEDFADAESAATLLKYPENVWLASPSNKLKMAPSSSSQYRKARKKLKNVNKALGDERCFWVRDEKNLSNIVWSVVRGLKTAERQIDNEIREGNNSWFDAGADDVFYLNQGRVYAYMTVLKKLGRDYKQVLMADGLYEDWTVMLRALQNATEINPDVVLNGRLNGEIVANHLVGLGYYTAKAENVLMRINTRLNGEIKNAN